MTRTIVCSDLHGRPSVFEAIVRHSDFTRGTDRLIIAGDLGDDRAGDADVLALAESLGAEIVLGNHELWHLDGYRDFEGSVFHSSVTLERMLAREWVMAAIVDDILITHAGVSHQFASERGLASQSATEIAAWLNGQTRLLALRFTNDEPTGDEGDLLAGGSPIWFYPSPSNWPLASIRQVTGHRVPGYQLEWGEVAAYEQDGFYHVDPGVRVYDGQTHIRYAIIEDGEVQIVDDFDR